MVRTFEHLHCINYQRADEGIERHEIAIESKVHASRYDNKILR